MSPEQRDKRDRFQKNRCVFIVLDERHRDVYAVFWRRAHALQFARRYRSQQWHIEEVPIEWHIEEVPID